MQTQTSYVNVPLLFQRRATSEEETGGADGGRRSSGVIRRLRLRRGEGRGGRDESAYAVTDGYVTVEQSSDWGIQVFTSDPKSLKVLPDMLMLKHADCQMIGRAVKFF